MQPFDSRHWRIAPLALIVACGPTNIPVADDDTDSEGTETNQTDSGDGDPTTDTNDNTDGNTDGNTDDDNPCADRDCPPHHYCDYGQCWHDYTCDEPEDCPNPEIFDCIDGFCEHHQDPPCESDADCGAYQQCLDQECIPLPCDPLLMIEIPLPDGVQGPVLSLQFADVDADGGAKELVLLRTDAVLVVDGDGVTSSAAPSSEGLWMVDGNDDARLDVVLRSSVANESRILLGDGLGQFGSAIDWNVPGISSMDVIDWPPGGPRELLVQRSDDGSVGVLSNLSSTNPTFTPLPFSLGGINHIASGRLADGITASEAIAFDDCVFEVQVQQGNAIVAGDQPQSGCIVSVRNYMTSSSEDDVLTVGGNGISSAIRMYPGSSFVEHWVSLEGVYGGVDLARGTGIVLIGESVPMRVGPKQFDCKDPLHPMPPASQIAVGDLDGNDLHDEIALVDELGEVSLWRNAALE